MSAFESCKLPRHVWDQSWSLIPHSPFYTNLWKNLSNLLQHLIFVHSCARCLLSQTMRYCTTQLRSYFWVGSNLSVSGVHKLVDKPLIDIQVGIWQFNCWGTMIAHSPSYGRGHSKGWLRSSSHPLPMQNDHFHQTLVMFKSLNHFNVSDAQTSRASAS